MLDANVACEDREQATSATQRRSRQNCIVLLGRAQPPIAAKPLAANVQTQCASFLRPLARRRLRICRPPRVAILALNPWVRLRLMTLGWNVRFMFLPDQKTQGKEGERGAILGEAWKRCQFDC